MSTHHVVIEIECDVESHMDVQARVIVAIEKAFQDRTGPLMVRGFDLKKFYSEHAVLLKEKDEYREAWLKELAQRADLQDEDDKRRRENRARRKMGR